MTGLATVKDLFLPVYNLAADRAILFAEAL
jgi:hypothetical protein